MISIIKKNKRLQRITAIILWVILWELLARIIDQSLIIVSPTTVIYNLFSLMQGYEFWLVVSNSFLKISAGLIVAIGVGVFLAVLSSIFDLMRIMLEPAMSIIKSVPVVSFIILVLIWVGTEYLSTVISFLIVLPIIYTNILEGILNVDKKLLEMADVFNIPFKKKALGIYLPNVMPYFIAASKISLGLCWKSGVAAEVIGLPNGTIGEKLYAGKIFLSTGDVLTWTLVIVLISVVFEKFFLEVVSRIEKRVLSIGDK
ncbi:MAG: ABC transporter permease [Clostridia bacterium]